MKKIMLIFLIAVFVVTMIGAGSGCKAQSVETTAAAETTTTAEATVAEETTVAENTEVAEQITIRVNWWGEAEAPGMSKWFKQTAEMYSKEHPNVTVEPVEIPIEDVYTSRKASVAGGDPPDIQILGRQQGLDEAAAGNMLPIDQFWSEEELSHILGPVRREESWGGHTWFVPQYMDAWLMAYNKEVFVAAGLDPENPPTNWEDFLGALRKIKAAGYTPFSMGWKDGYMGVWWLCLVGLQQLDDPSDIHDAVLGTQHFTDPKHSNCWTLFTDMLKEGLFNEDIASIGFAEGNDRFLNGKVGVVFTVQPTLVSYINNMGKDKVGAMLVPTPPNAGKLGGLMPLPTMPLLIANGKHPDIAADFLKFMHTPERINALYAMSGAMQANDQFDVNSITNETDKKIAQWAIDFPSYTYNEHYNAQIESEVWATAELLASGNITPEEAAKRIDDAAQMWRDENQDAVTRFSEIAAEWKSSADKFK